MCRRHFIPAYRKKIKRVYISAVFKARKLKDRDNGAKYTEEYREIKPYWTKRIGLYDAVKFSYGYTKRTMMFECKTISVGKGRKEWGAPDSDVYIIKLGKRIN